MKNYKDNINIFEKAETKAKTKGNEYSSNK